MSGISTQLEIVDNMSLPLINIASNIENVINLLSVADSCIDVWGNMPDALMSSVGYVGSVVDEISEKIERATVVQRGFNDSVSVGVKEIGRLADRASDINVGVGFDVSENRDVNINVNGNINIDEMVANIDIVNDKLVKLRDIENCVVGVELGVLVYGFDGLVAVHNKISDITGSVGELAHKIRIVDNISVAFDIAYEMTFGNLIRQIEFIKNIVGSAIGLVGTGVSEIGEVLTGVGSMLVDNVSNPFGVVFGEVGQVIGNIVGSAIGLVGTGVSEIGGVLTGIGSMLVDNVSNPFGVVFGEVGQVIGDTVGSAIGLVGTGVSEIGGVLAGVGNMLVDNVSNPFGVVFGEVGQVIGDTVGSAIGLVGTGVSEIGGVLTGIGSMLVDNASNPFGVVFGEVGQVIGDTVGSAIGLVGTGVSEISGVLTGVGNMLVDNVSNPFGVVFGEVGQVIGDTVGSAIGLVGTGVSEISGVLTGVGSMLVDNVSNPFGVVFGEVGQVVGDSMVAPIETVKGLFGDMVQDIIGQFVNMASVVENIINKIPMVNVDISTGINSMYNSVADTYTAKNHNNVGNREMLEGRGYRNDISTVKDSIEFAKSVTVSEVDRKYMFDSVSNVNNSKFAVADVNVTVNNNNSISSEVDADAIVAKLSDGVRQAMSVAVSGVYA